MKEEKDLYGTTLLIAEKSDLEKISTKELIWMIHLSTRANVKNRYGIYNEYVMYDMNSDSGWIKVYKESELREILKTRPHIPNKKESKEIRQMKANNNKKIKYFNYGKRY